MRGTLCLVVGALLVAGAIGDASGPSQLLAEHEDEYIHHGCDPTQDSGRMGAVPSIDVIETRQAGPAEGAELWRQLISGTIRNSFELARSVAVDQAGNVVAAGFVRNARTCGDFVLAKFDGESGAELWRQVINGTANQADEAFAVALDDAGDVVAVGSTWNAGTGTDFTVIKFDGTSGTALWRQVVDGTQNLHDRALAVALDATGNVVAVGEIWNVGTDVDFTVIKFDGTSGTELWRQVIDGSGNGPDEALRVAVDATGNVVAAGRLFVGPSNTDFAVIKFDGASGKERWRQLLDGTASRVDGARALALDAADHVVVAGVLENVGTGRDFMVVKFEEASGAELWRQKIDGTVILSVTADAAGNIIAGGQLRNAGRGDDFLVIKFDGSTGAELWREAINGTANGLDQAVAVGVDALENVLAAGSLGNAGTFTDFAVIKFDGSTGAELWRQVARGTENGDDAALALGLDQAGNPTAAGYTRNAHTSADFSVIRLNGETGEELWRQVTNGTASGDDEALAMALDPAGNVVAAGSTENAGTGHDFTVAKCDGVTGAEMWRQTVNGTANGRDRAVAVGVDVAGNVVAAGVTRNAGTLDDITVMKFDGVSGKELWRQVINGSLNQNDIATRGLALDGAGNVVAVGVTQNTGTFADFTVIKFDGASGEELWRQAISGTLGFFDGGRAVAVDSAGDVVAAGETSNVGSGDDFTVVKLEGFTGAELWRQTANGTANTGDRALAVAADPDGNIVAVGFTDNTGSSSDFTVMKLDGASGAELWRQAINGTLNRGELASAVAVDPAGHVVTAGEIQNAGTFGDFAVVKFDGTSGAELWRQVVNGTANQRDFARALAIDAAGDVVAIGDTDNAGTSVDFTMIKFDGSSGAELWRQVIRGNAIFTVDHGHAVAVDSAGDVVAAGSITEIVGDPDFTVIKRRSTVPGELRRYPDRHKH